ncbi:MAG: NUDIX hydrolase [Thermodesulfobacteriota bacterium]
MSVKINSRETMFHVGRFRLDTETITLDNGNDTTVHVLRHPGAVAVVPFLDEGTVILIHQYRHSVGDYIWEIPAGTLDAGEDPLACAGRELIEETGFRAGTFTAIGPIFPAPGYSDEQIHLFLAGDLAPDVQNLEPDEVIHVRRVPLLQALGMIDSGEIRDAKTIAGLLLAGRHKQSI